MQHIGFEVEHLGLVLWEEYLHPLHISPQRFAQDTHVSQAYVDALLVGKAAMTPDLALRLARYLGSSAEFWLNWQSLYDLQQTAKQNAQDYATILQVA